MEETEAFGKLLQAVVAVVDTMAAAAAVTMVVVQAQMAAVQAEVVQASFQQASIVCQEEILVLVQRV